MIAQKIILSGYIISYFLIVNNSYPQFAALVKINSQFDIFFRQIFFEVLRRVEIYFFR